MTSNSASVETAVRRVRAVATSLADVEQGTTHGYPAFKVRGKTFAWFPKKKEVEEGTLGVRVSLLESGHEFMVKSLKRPRPVKPRKAR